MLLAASLAAQPAGFEGTAVNRADDRPLPGVHVRLVSVSFDGIENAYGAMSDQNGHFSIAAMPAGAYILFPECRGFVYVGQSNLPLVALKPGEHVAGYKLVMTPRAVIAGRVVDELGDPVPGAMVRIDPTSSDTHPALNLSGNVSRTDDRGQFRLVAGPGKYYVGASPAGSTGDSGPANPGTAYTETYYPSAAGKAGATPVEVAYGSEANIEIRLTRQRVLSIRGTVLNVPEGPARAMVTLYSGDDEQHMYNSSNYQALPDGSFAFPDRRPGLYRLSAHYSSGATNLSSQPVLVKLEAADADLQLQLAAGGILAGSVEGIAPEKVKVRLQPATNYYGSASLAASVSKDGTFQLPNVPQERMKLSLDSLPEDAFLKSVTLDGALVKDGTLDLTHGSNGSKLKIVVSLNGGRLSGIVRDKQGQPLHTSLGMVVLSDRPDLTDVSPDLPRIAEDGSYSIKGIRPGKYHVLAVDALNFVDNQSEETLKKLLAASEEIEIKEGDRIVKDLTAPGKEDVDAKSKQ